MRGDQNVARRRLKKRKALLKILQCIRIHPIAGELEPIGGDWCQAICVDHGPANFALARAPGPACTTRRVPGCYVRRHNDVSNGEAAPVAQFMYVLDPIDRRNDPVLRIALVYTAPPHHRGTPLTCDDASTAEPLQVRNTARVVKVHMRIHYHSHVLNPEPQ